MIERTCETCEQYRCHLRGANKPCRDWSPDIGQWDGTIAELEAEVEGLREST
jgi:hypothetical protein